jgi:hypothetical protein
MQNTNKPHTPSSDNWDSDKLAATNAANIDGPPGALAIEAFGRIESVEIPVSALVSSFSSSTAPDAYFGRVAQRGNHELGLHADMVAHEPLSVSKQTVDGLRSTRTRASTRAAISRRRADSNPECPRPRRRDQAVR